MTEEASIASERQPEVGAYAVALIDMLDQRGLIRRLGVYPSTARERSTFVSLLRRSVGQTNSLRSACRHFVTDSVREVAAIYGPRGLKSSDVGFQHFSDTVVIFSRVSLDDHSVTASAMLVLLMSAAKVMLNYLHRGIPLRGGIAVGAGIAMSSNEIYGPAFVEAYDIEHEFADYPRVGVSRKAIEYLRSLSKGRASVSVRGLGAEIAHEALAYVRADADALHFVDFAGPAVLRHATADAARIAVGAARKFAITSYGRFVAASNHKLARRYALLKSYLEAAESALTDS